jgi:predicted deacylase
MSMPAHVIQGRKPGPKLFVCAAIHGDEINGVEIIRRVLRLKLLRQLRGSLIAVPTVNVYGFINRSRDLPDRRDLNRAFPGSETGSLTSRLARLFMDEIVQKCTHGIDIHTGSNHRINLPQIRADLRDAETEQIARSFGAPVIIHSRVRDGSLREAVTDKGIPMLLYEAGEALRFNELAIKVGTRGVISVMREIGLLPRRPPRKRNIKPVIAESTHWIRAPRSGILHTGFALGARIEAGSVIGRIADPHGESDDTILSPVSGVVIGRLSMPLVHEGDAVFHVACLDSLDSISETLEFMESGLYLEEVENEEMMSQERSAQILSDPDPFKRPTL